MAAPSPTQLYVQQCCCVTHTHQHTTPPSIHHQHTPPTHHTTHRMYSEFISTLIATGGPHAAKTSAVKLMRSVKKSTLRLLDTFVEKHDDLDFLAQQFVPAMMDPILGDYARNVPDARYVQVVVMVCDLVCCVCWFVAVVFFAGDVLCVLHTSSSSSPHTMHLLTHNAPRHHTHNSEAEVLSVFATVINKLKQKMETEVPRIFEACFECTLQMITKNFEVRGRGKGKGKGEGTRGRESVGWCVEARCVQSNVYRGIQRRMCIMYSCKANATILRTLHTHSTHTTHTHTHYTHTHNTHIPQYTHSHTGLPRTPAAVLQPPACH